MKVVTATLCDFGQIREGLLSVLSGGITRLKRPAFPAPLGCHLALILEMSSIELEDTREVSVRLSDEDGTILVETRGVVGGAVGEDIDPGENVSVPLVLDISPVLLPSPGRYQIAIEAPYDDPDADHVSLAFRARLPHP